MSAPRKPSKFAGFRVVSVRPDGFSSAPPARTIDPPSGPLPGITEADLPFAATEAPPPPVNHPVIHIEKTGRYSIDGGASRTPCFAEKPRPKGRSRIVPLMVGGATLIGLATGVLMSAVFSDPQSARATAKAVSSVPMAAADPPSLRACEAERDPVQIATRIDPSIQVLATPDAAHSRLLLGYAEDHLVARGIAIGWGSLEVAQLYSSKGAPLERVDPALEEGAPRFARVRARTARHLGRALPDGSQVMQLGSKLELRKGGARRTLWSDPALTKGSLNTQASSRGGTLVSLRHEGTDAALYLGWFDHQSGSASLSKVPLDAKHLGKVSLEADDTRLLAAFAAKAGTASDWSVYLAVSMLHTGETSVLRFEPSGDPQGNMIAPKIKRLADGRWLLLVTSGSTGSHQTLLYTLDPSLHELGAAALVSPPDANAGSSLLVDAGREMLALYLTAEQPSYQLWARRISCPPLE